MIIEEGVPFFSLKAFVNNAQRLSSIKCRLAEGSAENIYNETLLLVILQNDWKKQKKTDKHLCPENAKITMTEKIKISKITKKNNKFR